jgi:hypothetical protein
MCGAAIYTHQSVIRLSLLLCILACLYACKYDKPPTERNRVSFKNVTGVNYIEVKRRFANGLSIGRYGYDLTPSWKMSFLSDDSASVFSPDSGAFLGFHVTLDHDSLFHVARSWFRAKKVTRDSLVLQVMDVHSNVVYLQKSTVFLTFYSDKYIKNVLHTLPEVLMRKTKRDTLFILQRSEETNRNIDSVFAAREPAKFISRSPLATVKKVKVEADVMNRYDTSDQYTSPTYEITIDQTYKDFSYEILTTVDYKGGLHFVRSFWNDHKDQTIRSILDGYVKTYFDVQPGNTLGIPHNSPAILKIKGRKAAN